MDYYMGELITNPDKHYHFLGIKILFIKYYLRQLYQRGAPSSFVDLIMLDKINNIHIKPCFPIITPYGDTMIVYTKKILKKNMRTVQNYFKQWHHINYSINDLKNMIKPCKNYPNDPPFYKSFRLNPLTQIIEYILYNIIMKLMNKYFVPDNDNTYGSDLGKDSNLLVIDDAKEVPKYYPSKKSNMNVVVILPQQSTTATIFMNIANKYLAKKKHDVQSFIMVQGDIRCLNEFNKFPEVRNKFKYVMFKYNMCFMMEHIDNVLDNLASRCTMDVKIMILYVDGHCVEKLIGSSSRIEIADDDNKTVFGLYRYDDQNIASDNKNKQSIKHKQIVIYIKDTLRYGYGIVERLTKTKDILDAFGTTYDLIKDESMIHCIDSQVNPYTDDLTDKQKKIASIFRYMILQKKYKQ
jgi:hypothetical protein